MKSDRNLRIERIRLKETHTKLTQDMELFMYVKIQAHSYLYLYTHKHTHTHTLPRTFQRHEINLSANISSPLMNKEPAQAGVGIVVVSSF